MARAGVSYEQFKVAARELLRDGESPSIQSVRAVLGTGSSTTLQKHAKRFWQELGQDMTVPDLGSVPDELVEPLQTLWKLACDKGLERLQKERERAESQVQTAREETQHAQHETARIKAQFDDLSGKYEGMKNDNAELEAQLRDQTQALNQTERDMDAAQQQARQAREVHHANEQQLNARIEELRGTVERQATNLESQARTHESQLEKRDQRHEEQSAHWMKQLDVVRQEAQIGAQSHATTLDKAEKYGHQMKQELADAKAEAANREQALNTQIADERHQARQREQEAARGIERHQQNEERLRVEVDALKGRLQACEIESARLNERLEKATKARPQRATRKNRPDPRAK